MTDVQDLDAVVRVAISEDLIDLDDPIEVTLRKLLTMAECSHHAWDERCITNDPLDARPVCTDCEATADLVRRMGGEADLSYHCGHVLVGDELLAIHEHWHYALIGRERGSDSGIPSCSFL